jgi:hypothetical protein
VGPLTSDNPIGLRGLLSGWLYFFTWRTCLHGPRTCDPHNWSHDGNRDRPKLRLRREVSRARCGAFVQACAGRREHVSAEVTRQLVRSDPQLLAKRPMNASASPKADGRVLQLLYAAQDTFPSLAKDILAYSTYGQPPARGPGAALYVS